MTRHDIAVRSGQRARSLTARLAISRPIGDGHTRRREAQAARDAEAHTQARDQLAQSKALRQRIAAKYGLPECD